MRERAFKSRLARNDELPRPFESDSRGMRTSMYSLYYQQPSRSLRWIADMPTEERARDLAATQSKQLSQPVLIVRRFEDNPTGVIATFRGGHADPTALRAAV